MLSLICQLIGRSKWGNFISHWVPFWLVIGVYNKLTKLEDHDPTDRSRSQSRLYELGVTLSPVAIGK